MRNNERLANENIKNLFFSMALPAIIGQLVSLLYNLVDRIYIGNMGKVGSVALAGVGITTPIIILISAFAFLIGSGGAPLASIKLGQGKNEDAEKILGSALFSLIIIGLIIMAIVFIFMDKILFLFGVSEKTFSYAKDYMYIYTTGTLFVMIALGLNTFLTAQGHSKMAMFTVSIGAVINIVLDPIFIYLLKMGVKGAALATVISQFVSAIWLLSALSKHDLSIQLKKKFVRFYKHIFIETVKLGASPFVMTSTESFLMIAFNTSLQKYVGDLAVGSMTILSSCMQIVFLPLSGLTQGAQPISSYNFGAKNADRVKEIFIVLFTSCVIYSTVLFLSFLMFPDFFVRFFTSNSELIKVASRGLRIYMAGTFALGVQISCQQTFVSIGNAKTSLFLAILRKIILLIPLIYILPYFIEDKYFAILVAEPVSDIIAALTTLITFYFGFKTALKNLRTN